MGAGLDQRPDAVMLRRRLFVSGPALLRASSRWPHAGTGKESKFASLLEAPVAGTRGAGRAGRRRVGLIARDWTVRHGTDGLRDRRATRRCSGDSHFAVATVIVESRRTRHFGAGRNPPRKTGPCLRLLGRRIVILGARLCDDAISRFWVRRASGLERVAETIVPCAVSRERVGRPRRRRSYREIDRTVALSAKIDRRDRAFRRACVACARIEAGR